MAKTYEIKMKEVTAGGFFSASPRVVANSQIVTYDVLWYDDAGGVVEPVEVNDQDNMPLPELPTVNKTCFSWDPDPAASSDLLIQPWMICKSKRAERDTRHRLLFHVTCEFATDGKIQVGEDDLRLIAAGANNTVALLPFLDEHTWTSDRQVIEAPVEPGPANGTATNLRLPTGSLYSQPFIQDFPKRIMRQTQFEDFLNLDACHDAIDARLFTLNGSTWEGNDGDPPRWKITNIDYQPVEIPMNDPAPPLEPYMMTYTMEQALKPGGWWDRRPLIDNFVLATANDLTTKESYRDPTTGYSVISVLLNADGTKKASQTGDPTYADHSTQPQIPWTFLKP